MQKKGTVLLSTSLAWPAVAGFSRAETVSQLSAIYFAQPCTGGRAATAFVVLPFLLQVVSPEQCTSLSY